MEKDWFERAKSQGWLPGIAIALDVLEPLGPLAAQLLYVVQPTAAVFGFGEAAQAIARALDEPGGVTKLRTRLNQPDEAVQVEQPEDQR